MNKYLTMFAGALLMAACSSDRISDEIQKGGSWDADGAVKFAVKTGARQSSTTRSIEKTTGAFLNTDAEMQALRIGVFASYTDQMPYDQVTVTPDFMYNQEMHYRAVNENWLGDVDCSDYVFMDYSPIKYWPNEFGSSAASEGIDKLSFFAYAPFVAVTPSTGYATGSTTDNITQLTRNTATGDPMVKYIVNTSGAGVDLLWGVNSSGLPYLNQSRTAGTTSDDKITFTFKHALAKLTATIATDNSIDANSKVYVRSITITGFAAKGMLNLNNITANTPLWLSYDGADPTFEGLTFNDGRKDGREGMADGAQANEKNQLLNSTIIQTNTATGGVTNSAANLFSTTDLYVIPSGGTENVDVTIVYDVETTDANLSTKLSDGSTAGSSIENRITKTAVFGASTGFVAGNAYTINITLGMKQVQLNATVETWGTGSSGTVKLPE